MYIESVIWNRNRVTPDIIYPLFYINILSIIDEVLQMIRITILSTFTKENNSFTDKYPPFGFSSSLVYQLMPLPQCFYLFSDDSIAIFSTNGKQTLPHIVAVPTRPKFQCKKAGYPGVGSPNGFLHCRTHLKEIISANCSYNHNSNLMV